VLRNFVGDADAVADRIHRSLLSDNPDCARLRRTLQRAYHVNAGEAREVLRIVVRELNAALFPPITKLELVLTEACNLACAYCFETAMHSPRRMTVAVGRAAIDLLLEYSREERDLEVVLFGGEPTLAFLTILDIVRHAERAAAKAGKRIAFNLTTNGVLLTPNMVEDFAAHGIKVLVSIDGLQSTHDRHRVDRRGRGTFDRALAGLMLLKTVQPWVGVKMTVSPDAVSTLYDDVLGLHALGVNQFLIGGATGVPWSEDAMRAYADASARLYRWYKSKPRRDVRISEFDKMAGEPEHAYFGCQAGRDSIAVSVTGEISPCSKMLALDNRQPIARLGDISTGITQVAERVRLLHCKELRAECERRGIAQDYRGGCFASNYTDNGGLFDPSLQDHRLGVMQRAACLASGRALQ